MLSVVTASVMTLSARGVYIELDSRMLVILRAIGGIALVGVALGVSPVSYTHLTLPTTPYV